MPTPNDLAVLHPTPPAPLRPVSPAAWVAQWESALRHSGMLPDDKAIGYVLAGYASAAGAELGEETPAFRVLSRASGLFKEDVRAGLQHLQRAGWISRPAPVDGARTTRPITLTLPGPEAPDA